MKKLPFPLPIVITEEIVDNKKSIVATCPLVDVSSFGDTIEEAKKNVDEALELYFEDPDAPKVIGAFVEMTFSKTIGVVPTSGKVVSVSQGC
ncbi:MAG: type II toxin-antitoxin system HicB family antitoxin [Candidatus Nanoarchaeia archaeon]|nr:type II toxin-antitoxin system HicB family antitoxin [Candidatus Nanoarchaeia archaeon]